MNVMKDLNFIQNHWNSLCFELWWFCMFCCVSHSVLPILILQLQNSHFWRWNFRLWSSNLVLDGNIFSQREQNCSLWAFACFWKTHYNLIQLEEINRKRNQKINNRKLTGNRTLPVKIVSMLSRCQWWNAFHSLRIYMYTVSSYEFYQSV